MTSLSVTDSVLVCSAQQKGGLCLQVSTTTKKNKTKHRNTGLVLDSPTQLTNILPHRQRGVLSPWRQGAELMTKWAGREPWQGINKEERTFHLLSFHISILLELMAAECTTRTRPLCLEALYIILFSSPNSQKSTSSYCYRTETCLFFEVANNTVISKANAHFLPSI